MKYNKIIVIGLLLLQSLSGMSQTIYNGNFMINSGNNDATFNCTTFLDYTVPNWFRTHGTPMFVPHCTDVIADPIFMGNHYRAASGNVGEGIAGEYPFRAGVHYIITISLCNADGYNTSDDKLVLKATTDRPFNAITDCYTAIPTNTGPLQTICELNQFTTPSLSNYTMLSFIPNADYNYIWVYPYSNTESGVSLFLNSINVVPKCQEDITFNVSPSDNYYDNYRHIYFGPSSYCMPDPHTTNIFIANNSIEINPNFETIFYHGKGYDLFEIRPRNCSEENPPFYESEGEGKSSDNIDLAHSKREKVGTSKARFIETKDVLAPTFVEEISSSVASAKVYPNPNNGEFSISLKKAGTYSLTISNMLGIIVHSSKIENALQSVIKLDDKLPRGNYLLEISNQTSIYKERLSIVH